VPYILRAVDGQDPAIVLASPFDVTQAMYQQLDQGWVGLIFSTFNHDPAVNSQTLQASSGAMSADSDRTCCCAQLLHDCMASCHVAWHLGVFWGCHCTQEGRNDTKHMCRPVGLDRMACHLHASHCTLAEWGQGACKLLSGFVTAYAIVCPVCLALPTCEPA
jgi:hypothetical protein